MKQATGTIERAYQLASAGSCRTVEEICRRLSSEGFDSPQAHLAGKGLRLELRRLIKARRDGAVDPLVTGDSNPSAAI